MVRFANPDALYLLLLIPAGIVFYFFSFRWKRRALQAFGNVALLQKLMAGVSRGRQRLKATLLLMALFFFIIALARPQIGTRLEEVQREGVDILVAVDVSLSMNARDIQPSRLEKARHEINSLISRLRGDRVGIIAFAGDAFLHCPLTLDYGAARLFLNALETGIIPVPGTAIDRAIEVALKAFESSQHNSKVLILITDGENHTGDIEPVLEKAREQGVTIYTVGIGSPEGSPIPIFDASGRRTGFKKDERGEVVMTRLDEVTLERIAVQTGGSYFRASGSEQELEKIYEKISQMEKQEFGSVRFTQYEERYQIFLLIGLVLLLIEQIVPERKRVQQEWKGRFA